MCNHNQLSYATSSDMETICADCGQVMTEKPKRGRPPVRGGNNPNPARQFGRISDDDWSEIKAACEAAGQSTVEWALPTLLKKARREAERRALAAK